MLLLFRLKKYLDYVYQGKTILRLHSPFIYEFASEILKDSRKFYAFDLIEQRRNMLLKRDDMIAVHDFGAGSHTTKSSSRSVKSITRAASIPAKYGQMLFRMIQHFKCLNVLELGSCTGIGSLYMASAIGEGKFITLEGDPALAEIARSSLDNFGPKYVNKEVITGEFNESLPMALTKLETIDLAFIDGNHQKTATINYFEALLPKCHEHSIIAIDDIYWSEEMGEAWEAIKSHPQARLTIDLFRMGLVFFRHENREVEHFQLYF